MSESVNPKDPRTSQAFGFDKSARVSASPACVWRHVDDKEPCGLTEAEHAMASGGFRLAHPFTPPSASPARAESQEYIEARARAAERGVLGDLGQHYRNGYCAGWKDARVKENPLPSPSPSGHTQTVTAEMVEAAHREAWIRWKIEKQGWPRDKAAEMYDYVMLRTRDEEERQAIREGEKAMLRFGLEAALGTQTTEKDKK